MSHPRCNIICEFQALLATNGQANFILAWFLIKIIFYEALLLLLLFKKIFLKDITQPIRFWIYFLKIINLSLTNLRATEAYMVVNFRTREISRGIRKLTRTSILIK